MTQQFESWADSMGLDESDSDYNWAKQAWQAAQAAQPVGINGLTEAETSASMSVLGLSKPKVAQPAQVPDGYVLVPVEPTEAMWSELARDIVFWLYATRSPHHGSKLHSHLKNLGREIPDWLTKEVPDVDHTPPKGTVAVCIYKAMLAAAPSTKEKTE
jgi:hypothetical protein